MTAALANEVFHRSVEPSAPPDLQHALRLGAIHDVSSSGAAVFWRCAVVAVGRVAGFMDIRADGTLLRYGFRANDLATIPTLPPDLLELTPDEIKRQAQSVEPGATFSNPTLVALQGAVNVAWSVRARSSKSIERLVYVTPGRAWSAE